MFLKFFKHGSYCLHCLSTAENNRQCVPVRKCLSHDLKVQKTAAGDCKGQQCLCWTYTKQTQGQVV